jgi:hypothetical protein
LGLAGRLLLLKRIIVGHDVVGHPETCCQGS